MLVFSYGMAVLLAAGIIVIGARALLVPRAAAAQFGVPVPHDSVAIHPYMTIKGVRDIASGIAGLALLIAGMPHALGWYLLAAATIPASDMLIVLRNDGPKVNAYAYHGATAAVMVVVGVMLLLT